MGKAITSSMRLAPAATITTRSKPSATPAQDGRPAPSARGRVVRGARRLAAPGTRLRVGVEPPGLLGGVAELVEAVGELETAPECLEAGGHRAAHARERRLRRREIVDEGDAVAGEARGDALCHGEIEQAVAVEGHRCRHVDGVTLQAVRDLPAVAASGSKPSAAWKAAA